MRVNNKTRGGGGGGVSEGVAEILVVFPNAEFTLQFVTVQMETHRHRGCNYAEWMAIIQREPQIVDIMQDKKSSFDTFGPRFIVPVCIYSWELGMRCGAIIECILID